MVFRILGIVALMMSQISCDDKDGDNHSSVINNPPVALAEADIYSGTVPLAVNFSGSKSTDDNAISSFLWNFENGSQSSEVNPSHTFSKSGIYNVELIVTDTKGLYSKDVIAINVDEPINKGPLAVASADVLAGYAPLEINFFGSNSSDDQAVVSYLWKFKDGSESELADPIHIFDLPGIYDIELIVTDAEGLSNSTLLTITVEEKCITDGGYAHDIGLKSWCWESVEIPSGGSDDNIFSNEQLSIAAECNPNLVTKEEDRLRFRLNPSSPAAQSWCNNDFNMRAEISTVPWQVNQPLGTEEWLGWSYTFGEDYIKDNVNPWAFFQMHQGIAGSAPHHLEIAPSGLYGAKNGEVVVSNIADQTGENKILTGIIPEAGTELNIVVHVIHDLGSKGLLQIWINGETVYNKQVSTVHDWAPWGGNAKFGIYKWPWKQAENVQQSIRQGITQITTYMGALRIITRQPNDVNYGENAYSQVVPR